MSAHSLYAWVSATASQAQRQQVDDQQAELRRLRAELKRVTEERDILKRPPRTLPGVRLKYAVISQAVGGVPVRRLCHSGTSQRLLRLAGRAEIRTREEDQRLLGLIKHAWLESGGVYGCKITTTCVSWARIL